MRATPKITVRIDRGEDWVEIVGDWPDTLVNTCGQGNVEDWLDSGQLYEAYLKAIQAVIE